MKRGRDWGQVALIVASILVLMLQIWWMLQSWIGH